MEFFYIENNEHFWNKISVYNKIQAMFLKEAKNIVDVSFADVEDGLAELTDQQFALKHWGVKYALLENYVFLHRDKHQINYSEIIEV